MGGQETVSLTTDIWTDRTMRSFLGVTAHLLAPHPKTQTYQLLSILLTCQKFKGRHTGEAIARSFDNVLEDFGIGNKAEFIVTDNASNMKRAFSLEFPGIDLSGAEEEEGAGVEDGDLWEDQDEEDAGAVRQALILASKHRIPCFAHTLQLVIGDGLKELRAVGQAIAKVSKLTTVLHRSAVLKERFEERFGVDRTIPAANSTHWSSVFVQLKALQNLPRVDYRAIAEICEPVEFNNLIFTRQEWAQLAELTTILEPFADATTLTR
ncbi:uncharacterized protein LOC109519280 [Hippocampus comes]|uniref:uncharacterized protein LOC109519280 n=1 Tax=Hippocampus comes TaxID=109280 RepID=UPI00094E31EA|nr:PREDICTED: uncharacterized protein LOC109519280 [Hippocampus comes]